MTMRKPDGIRPPVCLSALLVLALGTAGAARAADDEEGAAQIFAMTGGHNYVTVAFAPNARWAVASGDGDIFLFDLQRGTSVGRPIPRNAANASAVLFHPSGRAILDLSARGLGYYAISFRNLSVQAPARFERGRAQGAVRAAAFDRDGKQLVTAHEGGEFQLWEARTLVVRDVFSHGRHGAAVAMSADGRRGHTCSDDHLIRLWEVDKGAARQVRDLEGHADVINAVAFTPDGRRALSAGRDRTVRLWDVTAGKEQHQLKESHPLHCAAISPDGRRALVGGDDSLLLLIDLEKFEIVERLSKHQGQVSSVAFAPDGRRALSAGSDRTVRLWRLPPTP